MTRSDVNGRDDAGVSLSSEEAMQYVKEEEKELHATCKISLVMSDRGAALTERQGNGKGMDALPERRHEEMGRV